MQAAGGDIYTRLRSANLDECFRLLLSRQADIALLYQLPDETGAIPGDFIETVTVDEDRLIPCAAPAIAVRVAANGEVSLPIIAYPADVAFGRIFSSTIAPRIEPRFALSPMVETALTLAAVELAATGAGVAWLPRSLARRDLDEGTLQDLSEVLPGAEVSITAVRLAGGSSPAERLVWSLLRDTSGASDGAR
jgi:DNA-binding transcriptional LysR family regulator